MLAAVRFGDRGSTRQANSRFGLETAEESRKACGGGAIHAQNSPRGPRQLSSSCHLLSADC